MFDKSVSKLFVFLVLVFWEKNRECRFEYVFCDKQKQPHGIMQPPNIPTQSNSNGAPDIKEPEFSAEDLEVKIILYANIRI